VVLLAALTGCSGTGSSTATPPTSSHVSMPRATHQTIRHTGTPTANSPKPEATGSAVPAGATKLLVFVVENHSLTEMRSQMPWTFRLGQTYGYATDFHAMTHPSLPNYLAIAGGSTFGISDDNSPADHPLAGPSVFGEALAHGRTARVYADGMPGNCVLANTSQYAVRHNPWTYFTSERAECVQLDTPMTRFADDVRTGRLPDAGMVVPDICHDAHSCPLATADAWMRQELGLAMSGPDFRSGRLVIVVTADEDDGSQGNAVLTIVVHPSVRGVVTAQPLSHLSLSRLYSEVLGAPPLREAASAPSMATAFGLRLVR
jgi:phosphatidylinositol-3-phosphatase